ncbi:DciA family protein [Conservatibacter flavescens]|uniref:DUF721 domain-containing protein n=1 Tax=Conservatibacter flavescens TaxID=28161 RepID=A0A2M8S051_9PAST|nr:DciA family protein [Conservatibacter flavescens]PJG84494.1 DUF721 domain-containing protein [Conservatibacter flavescens]
MRNKKMMNIKTILENSSLTKIMQRSLFLADLNHQISQLLPTQFNGLYRVANINEENLVIEVKSAVVRQGFLFKQTELLALIQQKYPKIQQLNLRINPDLSL